MNRPSSNVIPFRRSRPPLPDPKGPEVAFSTDSVYVVLDGVEHHMAPEDALLLASELAFAASVVWTGGEQ